MSASALEPVRQPTAVAPGHRTEAATPQRLGSHRLPLGRLAIRAGALASCVLAWHLAAAMKLDLGFVTFRNVPPPAEAAWAPGRCCNRPKLSYHLGASLMRGCSAASAAALALGIGLGLAVGRYRLARDLLLPPLEVPAADPGRGLDPSRDPDVPVVRAVDDVHHLHGRPVPDPAQHRARGRGRRSASRRVGAQPRRREAGDPAARSSCRAPRPASSRAPRSAWAQLGSAL